MHVYTSAKHELSRCTVNQDADIVYLNPANNFSKVRILCPGIFCYDKYNIKVVKQTRPNYQIIASGKSLLT